MAMKRQQRRVLERERRRIERRLCRAVATNTSGPVIGRANVSYELAERTKAVSHGGMGAIVRLAERVELAQEIDDSLELLKIHRPYYESDHVLNIAFNALCGGTTLTDIEARRQDRVFLEGIGAVSLPDPTTAGDFCRRFDEDSVMQLQEAINRSRLRVWAAQDSAFFCTRAVIDADASIVPTDAETKQGMEIARPRRKARRVKDGVVRERKFKVLRTTSEDVCEFDYRPGACKKDYRVVALRKDLSVERGEDVLFHEYRWFFYITNLAAETTTADEVVMEARRRCDQENLISQLKGQVRALHAPVNTLVANWAYMVMAALAWSLKAWCALLLPVSARWAKTHQEQRRRLLTMEFRTFRQAIIDIPCQIVTGKRQVRGRVLSWNPWLGVFFRLLDAL